MTKHYEQRKAANERYLSKMEEIRVRMPKESGLKEAIQAHAEAGGVSVNAFILRAVQEAMERDASRKRMGPATHVLYDPPKELKYDD